MGLGPPSESWNAVGPYFRAQVELAPKLLLLHQVLLAVPLVAVETQPSSVGLDVQVGDGVFSGRLRLHFVTCSWSIFPARAGKSD